MTSFNQERVAKALQLLGDLLEEEGQRFAIVVVGGAAMLLSGAGSRVTVDVDVIMHVEVPTDMPAGERPTMPRMPSPLPRALLAAAGQVAEAMQLPGDWLNRQVSTVWSKELPPPLLEDGIEWERFGALWVGVVPRRDLIALKLHALADQALIAGKHFDDLCDLRPSNEELETAREWVSKQDLNPEWPLHVASVAARVRQGREHARP